ncbi:MAG: PHP domain-containing protein, partial [Acidobacteriota bacterium]
RARELRIGFLSRAAATEVLAIAGAELRASYQGDLQMHSTWSDGRDSVRAMAEACLARGYRYAAMTDHAAGLPVAHGLSVERLRAQGEEIARVNQELHGTFQVLAGVEANIGAGGDLDVTASDRQSLALVVAAPHSGLRDAHTQTTRMLEAVSTAGVHILGHPRGRKYGVRPGVSADWPRVFATAARHGVAIEIDGDPSRQDIDGSLATQAVEAGCLFALDSDAHSVDELWYADLALAHARLADVPVGRIVNCWPLERLRAWLEARSQGQPE